MGTFFSKILSGDGKADLVWQRMKKLISVGWWFGGHVVWTTVTACILLGMPVMYHYEKECQMFEMQASFMQAQQAANAVQLN